MKNLLIPPTSRPNHLRPLTFLSQPTFHNKRNSTPGVGRENVSSTAVFCGVQNPELHLYERAESRTPIYAALSRRNSRKTVNGLLTLATLSATWRMFSSFKCPRRRPA